MFFLCLFLFPSFFVSVNLFFFTLSLFPFPFSVSFFCIHFLFFLLCFFYFPFPSLSFFFSLNLFSLCIFFFRFSLFPQKTLHTKPAPLPSDALVPWRIYWDFEVDFSFYFCRYREHFPAPGCSTATGYFGPGRGKRKKKKKVYFFNIKIQGFWLEKTTGNGEGRFGLHLPRRFPPPPPRTAGLQRCLLRSRNPRETEREAAGPPPAPTPLGQQPPAPGWIFPPKTRPDPGPGPVLPPSLPRVAAPPHLELKRKHSVGGGSARRPRDAPGPLPPRGARSAEGARGRRALGQRPGVAGGRSGGPHTSGGTFHPAPLREGAPGLPPIPTDPSSPPKSTPLLFPTCCSSRQKRLFPLCKTNRKPQNPGDALAQSSSGPPNSSPSIP